MPNVTNGTKAIPPTVFGSEHGTSRADRVWVGRQADMKQAEEAWVALGSPPEKESLIARLLTLESGEAILRDTNGRIGIIHLHLPARICVEGPLGEVLLLPEGVTS